MGFTEVLTIVFIVLKLIGIIDWSWWLVLLPEIIAGVIYLLWVGLILAINIQTHREFKEFDKKFVQRLEETERRRQIRR